MTDDLISRQAVFDALEKEKLTPFVNKDGSIDPFGAGRQNQWYRDGIAIMNIPSTEPHWIPVTESLPPKYIGEWLCCTDEGEVMVLPYDTPGDGSKECVFYRWDDTGYYYQIFNVVAWMPLPEPWKGEEE